MRAAVITPRMGFFSGDPSDVRRRCKDCRRVNVVELKQIGTRCRCAACGALLYPEEVPGYVPPAEPARPPEPAREVILRPESSGGGLRFVIGVLLLGGAWGYLGGQQSRQVGFECKVGVGDACWAWKRSAVGRLADELSR